MGKFEGKLVYITLKHQHIWGCPVYMINDWLQNSTVAGLYKWNLCACVVIFLG